METESNKGYGVRNDNGRCRWLWHEVHYTKKGANDCILEMFSKQADYFINNIYAKRDAELRRIKRQRNLKVVRVKMIEVD